MGEAISDVLARIADILHWLGKYREANIVGLVVRLLRVRQIEHYEHLEKWVQDEERARAEEPQP